LYIDKKELCIKEVRKEDRGERGLKEREILAVVLLYNGKRGYYL